MSKRVLVVQRRMTEYRVPFFERLRAALAERGVALSVAAGTPAAGERARDDAGVLPWAVAAPCRSYRVGGARLVWQPLPRALLRQSDLVILPHENGMLFNYRLLFAGGTGRPRVALWGHGENFQRRGTLGSARSRLRRATARRAAWYFAYTRLSVERAVAAGCAPERITCVNNTVDVESLIAARAALDPAALAARREELGLCGRRVGLFLGSLHAAKRLDMLLCAADALRERFADFELLIIGDGALAPLVRRFAAPRPWVRWTGALHGQEKVATASLGHVLLNPGMVGLAIVDGMALGIPLVTTDCGIHSPEIAYLEPGRTGLICRDDLGDFTRGAAEILCEGPLRARLAAGCRSGVERYTLREMVSRFAHGIEAALELSRGAAP